MVHKRPDDGQYKAVTCHHLTTQHTQEQSVVYAGKSHFYEIQYQIMLKLRRLFGK